MATTSKKAPTKADIERELEDTKSALSEALELIKELKANPVTPQVVVQQNNPKISKIKCINLAHNPVNVATQPNAQGRVFTFKEYGQAQFIRYDDLLDIISSYPNTMKSGMIYVADKSFCDEQGLYEDSNVIYTKELMDEIVYLREDKDVDLLIGMDKALLESTVVEIARLYHAGEAMEANKLARIKKELGYDIAEMAEDMKIFDGVNVKEE